MSSYSKMCEYTNNAYINTINPEQIHNRSTCTIIFVNILVCQDIGPAYITAPIKTSQQYSYLIHVEGKVNSAKVISL